MLANLTITSDGWLHSQLKQAGAEAATADALRLHPRNASIAQCAEQLVLDLTLSAADKAAALAHKVSALRASGGVCF